jgi:4-amino-4-deoxy-L-arabinose transferase-like glycosyltransferase
LAAGGKLGLAVVPAVVAVNALTFAASALAFYALACLLGIRQAFAATLFFVAFAANSYLFRMARPDAIVPLMAMLTVVGTVRFARTQERWLLVAVAAASAAAATARYMGVFTVVPVAFLGIVWFGRQRLQDRLLDSAIFVVIALSPIGLWLLRNQLLTGYLTGRSRGAGANDSANTDLLSNIVGLAETLRLDLVGWRVMGLRRFVHEGEPLPFPELTTLASVVAASVVLLLVLMGGRSLFGFVAAQARAQSDLGRTAMLVGAHAIVYVVVLLVIWTAGNNDPIHTRYTAPLYWCGILVAFLAVEAWRETSRARLLGGAMLALGLVVGTANIDKSILLFADAPSDDLIKKSLHAPSDLWRRDIPWHGVHGTLLRVPPARELAH